MRVLKRTEDGRPIEILLTDEETPLFQWYLQQRAMGASRWDAWSDMFYHSHATARQREALHRPTFYEFLNHW